MKFIFDLSIRFLDGGLVIPLVSNGTFRRRSLHWGTILSRFYAWSSRDEVDASCFPEGERFKEYFKDGGPDDLSLFDVPLMSRSGDLGIYGADANDIGDTLKDLEVIDDGDTDGANLIAFLRSMLRSNPSDRATTGELLRHEWF
jgi:serine/threonine protein kinase